MDVCRFSPTNGAERPGGEPMGEKLDAAFKNPPSGVEVWSSCVAGQRSFETDDAPMGAFLDAMFAVLEKGIQGRIQKPEDPLPLAQLVAAVDKNLTGDLTLLKLEQTPRLAGKEQDSGVTYDKSEQPPDPPVLASLPTSNGDAKKIKAIINSVLAEVGTPPVKPGRDDTGIKAEFLPPFSETALAKYGADARAEATKLREGVEQARALLWAVNTYNPPNAIAGQVNRLKTQIKVNLAVLRDGYRAPQNEGAFKNAVFDDEKQVAKILGQLSEAHETLVAEEVVEERGKETKRWQANYDFMVARLEAQIAFLYEYQSMLGRMRKELPPRDTKIHGGWRLAAQPTLSGDSVGKKMAKNSLKILDKLAKDHAGTPWEVLAKREKLTALGLEWQPTR
jgi:hypothetical protein